MSFVSIIPLCVVFYLSLFGRGSRALQNQFVVSISFKAEISTGSLILPRWVLTSTTCVIRKFMTDHLVTGYRVDGNLHTSQIAEIYDVTKSEIVMLRLSTPFPDGFPTIPIATRFEGYVAPSCYTYAFDKKILNFATKLMTFGSCYPDLKGRLVCAKSNIGVCFKPCGSALVCEGRILGVRKDAHKCAPGQKMEFTSVSFIDYLLLKEPAKLNDGYLVDQYVGQKKRGKKKRNRGNWRASVSSLTIYLIFFNHLNLYIA